MNDIFRTAVSVPRSAAPISHNSSVLMLGSCFSEHIGTRLQENHFRTCCNPSGILFNPLSIAAALKQVHSASPFTKEELFYHQELWRSFDHHTSFAHPDPDETLQQINSSFQHAVHMCSNLTTLVLTFGTAFVFYSKDQNRVVANCHKLPSEQFERHLLTPEEIFTAVKESIDPLLLSHPALQIIVTLSPVRHLRDNAHENQISKAHLMTAIYKLEQCFPQVFYFPAYEIMMDELRDYRFYAADMVHPNETAIEYIWNSFRTACISENSNLFIDTYRSILTSSKHRVQFPSLEITRRFAQSRLELLHDLQAKFSDIDLSHHKAYFTSFL